MWWVWGIPIVANWLEFYESQIPGFHLGFPVVKPLVVLYFFQGWTYPKVILPLSLSFNYPLILIYAFNKQHDMLQMSNLGCHSNVANVYHVPSTSSFSGHRMRLITWHLAWCIHVLMKEINLISAINAWPGPLGVFGEGPSAQVLRHQMSALHCSQSLGLCLSLLTRE